MVGLGGTDTLAQAESFVAAYNGPPTMLWSEALDAWRHYRAGNPNLVLLDGTGNTEIGRSGQFNQARIEDWLADLS